MNYEDFAAYWNANEDALRRYAAGLAKRHDIIDEVLSLARADLEARLEEIEPEPYCFAGAVHRFVSPFIPRINDETHAVVRALKATGNDNYDGPLETVSTFLREWHQEEMTEPYHPVLNHIDLSRVDWIDVAIKLKLT